MNKDEIIQKIAERAYFYFAERGYEHGHDVEDWVRAEKEILLELDPPKRKNSRRKRSSVAKSSRSKTTKKGQTRTKSK